MLERDTRPLSLRTRDAILHMLRSEGYQPGDRLPSEQELVQRLGVSRATLREAFKLLEESRVVLCHHGRGRFLAPGRTSIYEPITRLQSVTELMRERALQAKSRLCCLVEEPATPEVAKALNLSSADLVVRLERIRSAGEDPVIYSVDIFPRALCPGELDAQELQDSLLDWLERECRVHIAYSQARISAVHLDPDLVREMNLPSDLPWILLRQINYTDHDRPVLFSLDYHRGDVFSFYVLRKRY